MNLNLNAFISPVVRLMTTGLLTTVIGFTAMAAAGTNSGGGGANVRVNGQLKTLSDAGLIFERVNQLRSKKYPVYYEVKPETEKALKAILAQLPAFYSASIIGSEGTFIDEKEINEKEYAKIKLDYSKVIQSYGKKLDSAAFVLAAYSKDGKTYMLPAFDEQGKDETIEQMAHRQALLLIHEYFMRQSRGDNSKDRLDKILNLDAVISGILKNGLNDDSTLRFYGALVQVGGFSEEELKIVKFKILEKRLGRPVLEKEFVNLSSNRCDPSKIQKFENILPGIAQSFENCILITGSMGLVILPIDHPIKLEILHDQISGYRSEREYKVISDNEQKLTSLCLKEDFENALISVGVDEKLYRFHCIYRRVGESQKLMATKIEKFYYRFW